MKTLMKRMGIEALYRRPRTWLDPVTRSIRICCADRRPRPNQVWAMDITYIPMAAASSICASRARLFSRRLLAWRLSI